MPRGGRRQPQPGGNYPNRSDLAAGPKPQPIRTAPNQPYGQATQQAAAQRAIPLPNNSGGAGAVPAPSPTATAPSPGTFPPLDRPTERPLEPVTAGAPVGAGPGPEALGIIPTPQTLGDLLGQLADTNPDIAYLHAQAARGWR